MIIRILRTLHEFVNKIAWRLNYKTLKYELSYLRSGFLKKIYSNKLSWIILVIVLVLPMINIYLSLIMTGCLYFPIYYLLKTKSNVFCVNYCPRAKYLSKLSKVSKHEKVGYLYTNGTIRKLVFGYFIINIVFIAISTLLVALSLIDPIVKVRLFFFIPLPYFPQIFNYIGFPWIAHLSFRFYSMILSTVILGTVLGITYKPRTWCQVCPITSINKVYLNRNKTDWEIMYVLQACLGIHKLYYMDIVK